ncbi:MULTISPECIES: hypothetical protein [unclassified Bradyrhizobium]
MVMGYFGIQYRGAPPALHGRARLLAVQLMERLPRLSLGIEVRTLFVKPVLADLAASLGSHQEVAVHREPDHRGRQGDYPADAAAY